MAAWGRLAFGLARAEVRADPERLFLRTPFRAATLSWDQVSSAAIVPTNVNRLLAMVSVTTSDGRVFRVDGATCRWRRDDGDTTAVGKMVGEINRRKQGLPPPATSSPSGIQRRPEYHEGFSDLAKKLHSDVSEQQGNERRS